MELNIEGNELHVSVSSSRDLTADELTKISGLVKESNHETNEKPEFGELLSCRLDCPDETPIVAYKVVKSSNQFIYDGDSKIYKYKGAALNRRNRLNALEGCTDYKIVGAYGWVEVDK